MDIVIDDDRLERLLPLSTAHFGHRVFLGYRLSTRLVEGMTALWLGAGPGWAVALGAGTCALFDVAFAAGLRRRGRTLFPLRLVLDAVDVVVWTLVLHGSADLTVIVATPVLMETGMAHGWRALPLPALIGTAAAVAAAVAGAGATPLPYLWPMVAWAAGTLAGTYLRRRWHVEARAVRDQLEAAVGRAELSGQNSVAMGADSVVDLLVRTTPLVAAYEKCPQPSPFGAWKARLAEACGRQATYLGVALLRWQRLYNGRSPDLSSDVELRLAQGAGTLLLTPAQTEDLERRLDALGPRGTVTVEVPHPGPAGGDQTVIVAGRPITVAADARPRIRPLHAGPFAFVAAAALVLIQSLPQWDAVPLWVTVPIALSALAAARWTHRQTHRPPGEIAGRVLAFGLLLAAVQPVATTVTERPDSGRLPFMFFLQWAVPLVYVHARDVSRRHLVLVVAGFAGAAAAGAALMSAPFPVTGVLFGMAWPLAPVLAVQGLRDAMERESADLREQVGRMYDVAVRDGFRRGRRLVVELTEEAAEQLRERYRVLGPELPPEVGAEIERRLRQARASLAAIG
jgi:ribosomal protein S18 acetylase RimI-like enzyme